MNLTNTFHLNLLYARVALRLFCLLRSTLYFPLQRAHSFRKGGKIPVRRDSNGNFPKGSNSDNQTLGSIKMWHFSFVPLVACAQPHGLELLGSMLFFFSWKIWISGALEATVFLWKYSDFSCKRSSAFILKKVIFNALWLTANSCSFSHIPHTPLLNSNRLHSALSNDDEAEGY